MADWYPDESKMTLRDVQSTYDRLLRLSEEHKPVEPWELAWLLRAMGPPKITRPREEILEIQAEARQLGFLKMVNGTGSGSQESGLLAYHQQLQGIADEELTPKKRSLKAMDPETAEQEMRRCIKRLRT